MLYELPIFRHLDAETVEEALYWLSHYGDRAKVIAGGTDLLCLMKDHVTGPGLPVPEVLVNIKSIPGLKQIRYDEKAGLVIGAAVTLIDLTNSQVIKDNFPILLTAASQAGTTQIRNMGTVAGNVCQRPRCLYFRHPHFPCFKKGGDRCYAVQGEHRDFHSILRHGKCVAAHPSDMAPAFMALNAKVIISGRTGDKEIFLDDFFTGPDRLNDTILQHGEFVREFRVQKQARKTCQAFLKHRRRNAADFSLASVAAAIQIDERQCRDVRLVLGGIAPYPYGVPNLEEIMGGKEMCGELISKVAEISLQEARPLPMNRYKLDITKALIRQALGLIRDEAPVSGLYS